MIPIFILQTWLLGLLSLGVGGGCGLSRVRVAATFVGWDPVLKQWVFTPNFGLNLETTFFASAIILTLLALAGDMIVKGILRLTTTAMMNRNFAMMPRPSDIAPSNEA